MRKSPSPLFASLFCLSRHALWKGGVAVLLAGAWSAASCGSDGGSSAAQGSGGTNTSGTSATAGGGASGASPNGEVAEGDYVPPTAPVKQELPALVSGSRLRAKYLALDDGTKLLQTWHDNQLNVDCTFRQVSATKWQCLPVAAWGQELYLESDCKTRIAPAPATADTPAYVFAHKKAGSCLGNLALEIFAGVAIDAPASTYQKPSDPYSSPATAEPACIAASSSSGQPAATSFVQAGDPVPASTFVTATAQSSLTSDGFAFLALHSEDGATFWLLPEAAACVEKATLTGPTRSLGTARIRAEISLGSQDRYNGRDRSLIPVMNNPVFRDTATGKACSLVDVGNGSYICTVPREQCNYDLGDYFNRYLDGGCTVEVVHSFFGGQGLREANVNDICWEQNGKPHRIAQKFVGVAAGTTFRRSYSTAPCEAQGADSDTYVQIGEEIPLASFPQLTVGTE